MHSQEKSRSSIPANASNSVTIRRDQAELFDLAMRLAEGLYSLPPVDRLGYLKDVVDVARSGESAKVRKILTFPDLLYPDRNEERLFWRRSPSVYCTISQAADRYCRKFWNAGVVDVVRGLVPEPPTGEVLDVQPKAVSYSPRAKHKQQMGPRVFLGADI
ncbi:MAG: hypothetical protein ACMUJJ_01020 [Roseicyclus sp.]|uniref:hypothetical protein n=1 Tax=Roseicyclus sp. TaxID=1914329 RepID=UPI003A856BE9